MVIEPGDALYDPKSDSYLLVDYFDTEWMHFMCWEYGYYEGGPFCLIEGDVFREEFELKGMARADIYPQPEQFYREQFSLGFGR